MGDFFDGLVDRVGRGASSVGRLAKKAPVVGNVLSLGEEVIDGVPRIVDGAYETAAGVVTGDTNRALNGLNNGIEATGETGAGMLGSLAPGSGSFYNGANIAKDGYRQVVTAGGATTRVAPSQNIAQFTDVALHGTLADTTVKHFTGRRLGDNLGVTPSVKASDLMMKIDQQILESMPPGTVVTAAQRNSMLESIVRALPVEFSISTNDGRRNISREEFIASSLKRPATMAAWEKAVIAEAKAKYGPNVTVDQLNQHRRHSIQINPNAVIVDDNGVECDTPARYGALYEEYNGRTPMTVAEWEQAVVNEAVGAAESKGPGGILSVIAGIAEHPIRGGSLDEINRVRRQWPARNPTVVVVDETGKPIDCAAYCDSAERRNDAASGVTDDDAPATPRIAPGEGARTTWWSRNADLLGLGGGALLGGWLGKMLGDSWLTGILGAVAGAFAGRYLAQSLAEPEATASERPTPGGEAGAMADPVRPRATPAVVPRAVGPGR